MGLRTLVKVNEINNLSDARYCAGMGVEMAGFVIQEGQDRYVSPDKMKDIASWLSGINLIGEFPSKTSENEVKTALAQFPLSGVQIGDLLLEISEPGLILIRKVEFSIGLRPDFLPLPQLEHEFLLLSNDHIHDALEHADELKTLCSAYSVLLGFGITQQNINRVLDEIKPYGIALQGGDEVKPGMRDFSELSDLLETIEIDN